MATKTREQMEHLYDAFTIANEAAKKIYKLVPARLPRKIGRRAAKPDGYEVQDMRFVKESHLRYVKEFQTRDEAAAFIATRRRDYVVRYMTQLVKETQDEVGEHNDSD